MLRATLRHASSVESYATNSALRSLSTTIGNADCLAVRASRRTSWGDTTASRSRGNARALGALTLGRRDIRSLTLGYGTIRDIGAAWDLRTSTFRLWALRFVGSFVTNSGTSDARSGTWDGRSSSGGLFASRATWELRA